MRPLIPLKQKMLTLSQRLIVDVIMSLVDNIEQGIEMEDESCIFGENEVYDSLATVDKLYLLNNMMQMLPYGEFWKSKHPKTVIQEIVIMELFQSIKDKINAGDDWDFDSNYRRKVWQIFIESDCYKDGVSEGDYPKNLEKYQKNNPKKVHMSWDEVVDTIQWEILEEGWDDDELSIEHFMDNKDDKLWQIPEIPMALRNKNTAKRLIWNIQNRITKEEEL